MTLNLRGFTVLSVLVLCLLPCPQAGSAEQLLIASDLQRLQGSWEGEGPPGRISVTITGNSLHFYAREDFWYEATFTLPTGNDPQELRATINDTSAAASDVGEVVFAIVKIEEGILTLAVNDGSGLPPLTFSGALSRYDLKKVESPEGSE